MSNHSLVVTPLAELVSHHSFNVRWFDPFDKEFGLRMEAWSRGCRVVFSGGRKTQVLIFRPSEKAADQLR
jgi:hypothetical protein